MGKYKLTLLLKIAKISKQGYYYQVKHIDDKDNKDQLIYTKIKKIYDQNYQKYGSPRITIAINKQLKDSTNKKINHKCIERIMKKYDLKARPRKRKYLSYQGNVGTVASNILNRDFKANGPYQKLGTDITVFITNKGKVYLSPIIDFYTREILAYDLSENPDYRQIIRMFNNLESNHKNEVAGAILHSDQGWQYQMKKYCDKLKDLSIIQSMSRKGNCLDKSPTENFFGRMKEEMFYGKEHLYNDIDSLKKAIIKYINYYNSERIVVKLKMSPIDFRKQSMNY